ncbi:(2Fe-2S)-binding protein [Ruania alba]|uniref:2Fe-2S iron-sulfur cluster binding domain-containing protein n=1 Tax=Ruania alba TaxID=648782 RepID=A0A1H5LX63_9MICO|nr:(2Fe-2S)-binding protein [Ruania alba]SEE81683.1 2Fe-2S iron-sulfur cluster binding domain-containing protein [Ruania alba]
MSSFRRLDVRRGAPVQVTVDGAQVQAHQGETVAAALLAAGVDEFRRTSAGDPRAPLCHMGTCFECVLTVDGAPLTRACLTPVRDGMIVDREVGQP